MYGTFEGSHGTAIKVEGRTCRLEFTKEEPARAVEGRGEITWNASDAARCLRTAIIKDQAISRTTGGLMSYGSSVTESVVKKGLRSELR